MAEIDDSNSDEIDIESTPLDRTIDRIGMGAFWLLVADLLLSLNPFPELYVRNETGNYQWALLALCGMGA